MAAMTKVLVVDDSWVARLGMSKLLTTMDCQVVEANDGWQALDAVEAHQPALVFLDLLMPGLDGLGVLEALRARGNTVPVFVLSADIQETTLRQCRDLGARDCLPKPPSREAVAASLRTLE